MMILSGDPLDQCIWTWSLQCKLPWRLEVLSKCPVTFVQVNVFWTFHLHWCMLCFGPFFRNKHSGCDGASPRWSTSQLSHSSLCLILLSSPYCGSGSEITHHPLPHETSPRQVLGCISWVTQIKKIFFLNMGIWRISLHILQKLLTGILFNILLKSSMKICSL